MKIILIVVIAILVMLASGGIGAIIYKNSYDKRVENIKETPQNNITDTTTETLYNELTLEIQQRYEEAYRLMYAEFAPAITEMQDMEANEHTFKGKKINKEKLSEYFTEEKVNKMLEQYGEITYNGERYVTSLEIEDFYPDVEYDAERYFDPGTIFSQTDSGIRKLKILVSSNDYVLAKSELTQTIEGNTFGGEYIVFTKQNSKWKIEFYQ
jgi:uncharacterized protein YxeA